MSNALTAKELLCLLPMETVRADHIQVGDVIDEGFGPILIASIDRKDDGYYGLLDSFESGTYGRPESKICRVVPGTLYADRVKFLLEQQCSNA